MRSNVNSSRRIRFKPVISLARAEGVGFIEKRPSSLPVFDPRATTLQWRKCVLVTNSPDILSFLLTYLNQKTDAFHPGERSMIRNSTSHSMLVDDCGRHAIYHDVVRDARAINLGGRYYPQSRCQDCRVIIGEDGLFLLHHCTTGDLQVTRIPEIYRARIQRLQNPPQRCRI